MPVLSSRMPRFEKSLRSPQLGKASVLTLRGAKTHLSLTQPGGGFQTNILLCPALSLATRRTLIGGILAVGYP